MKKALVTGGAGFLGSHLSRRLLDDGYEVTAVDNLYTGSMKNIDRLLENPRFSFLQHDIVRPFDGEYDEIYNLACPASPIHYQNSPVETTLTCVMGMHNVLERARATGAKVLHASTSEIYGDPMVHPQVEAYRGNVNTVGIRSCYDEGKRCAETLASDYRRVYGVDVRLVRIFNTYGPRMHPNDGRVISNFIVQALRNEDLTIYGDGSQTRSFQYSDDLIDAMRLYMDKPRAEIDKFFDEKNLEVPVLNTGNPGEYTIATLAKEILRLIPESKSKIAMRPLPSDDPRRRKPDITLAKELLGWEPRVPLAEGLEKTIAYFRERILDSDE
ncbi:MAG: SDR family oxidoreductase [Kiritimatiellae bacterium]|nr:SDR family oxidoreductase [Kiritimatiellia bacterium]